LVATLFALLWGRQVFAVLAGEAVPDYPEGATLFWMIRVFDLAFFIPLAYAGGIGLFRRRPRALKLAYALTGFFTCEIGAVAGMMAVMLARGDPSANGAVLAVLLLASGGMALVAAALYRSYVRGTRAARRASRSPNAPAPPLARSPLTSR